ncbi:MAG: CAP domain-containing protein [Bacteroidota bacterium]
MELQVHDLVNQYRAGLSLKPLIMDSTLTWVARTHSRNMAEGILPIGHDGFPGRSSAIRAQMYFRSIAENIATNLGYPNPARTAFKNWLMSEGHKVNIEGRYNLTGVGIAKDLEGTFYFTQLFVLK